MISQKLEIVLVELKSQWELSLNLVDDVDELQECGGEVAGLGIGREVAAMAELVTKGQPFFFDEGTEAFDGAIVRVETELSH